MAKATLRDLRINSTFNLGNIRDEWVDNDILTITFNYGYSLNLPLNVKDITDLVQLLQLNIKETMIKTLENDITRLEESVVADTKKLKEHPTNQYLPKEIESDLKRIEEIKKDIGELKQCI